MITLVRKFSVTHQNVSYKVLYVFQSTDGSVRYCVCSQMGDYMFIEAKDVKSVDIDDD